MTSTNPIVANALRKAKNYGEIGKGAAGEAALGFADVVKRSREELKKKLEAFCKAKISQYPEAKEKIESAYTDALRKAGL